VTRRPDHRSPSEGRFGEDYFKETYGCDGLKTFGMHWWSVRMYALIADRWLRRTSGKRFLDVGCGHGFTLRRLEGKYETFGVDISEYAIGQAARFAPKSRCFVSDVEHELPKELERGTFDLVMAKYVFEHLKDPLAAMKRLAELLSPGGLLFFSVPNTESIGARWKGDDWYARKDPTHCSLLPPETWLDITTHAGLDVVKAFSDGYWDLPYIPWLPTWVQFPIFIGPSVLACLSGRAILPAGFGENIMAIVRKKNDGGTHP
jgi:SAM-dependent methyltransferase